MQFVEKECFSILRQGMESHYEVLNVPKQATQEEIKKSYRALSMLYHPDKNKNNPEFTSKFQKISESYEVLGDPEKRAEYDLMQRLGFSSPSSSYPSSFAPFFFSPVVGGMGRRDETGGVPMDVVGSLLASLFAEGMEGGGIERVVGGIERERGNKAPIRSPDIPSPIVKQLTVSLNEVLTGTTVPVEVERWLLEDGEKIWETETIYVPVPKGTDHGEIILLKGKGHVATPTIMGDLKITIQVSPDPLFQRRGLDIIFDKSITLKEALCGFTFPLPYLTGKTYTIHNFNKIIRPGHQTVLPNMGLSRDGHVGNLIIRFTVVFPTTLTETCLAHLKGMELG